MQTFATAHLNEHVTLSLKLHKLHKINIIIIVDGYRIVENNLLGLIAEYNITIDFNNKKYQNFKDFDSFSILIDYCKENNYQSCIPAFQRTIGKIKMIITLIKFYSYL